MGGGGGRRGGGGGGGAETNKTVRQQPYIQCKVCGTINILKYLSI